MFFKIASNNVKKSFKDYAIYFLTLTLGVCIFYSFNSIEDQNSILEMNKDPIVILTLNKLMAGTSVFVSFVLGGLIIYANNFLIKKRKKELGIYMTLGMPKRDISKILFFETLFIGVLSLVVGLGVGIVVSQGMSVITANILGANVERFKFILSLNAVIKTVIYFGIIYLLVMLFNQRTVSKYKLIDMLNAAKKNEEVKLKNTFVSTLVFLLSVALLIVAYSRILKNGLNEEANQLLITILLGVIGTLFFFFGLSSFIIHIAQKSKRFYLKDINIFILRQLNSKINTNFLSMAVICLMLFITISMIFTAFELKGNIERGEKTYDASAFLVVNDENDNPHHNDIEQFLNTINFTFEPYEKHAFYSEYKLNVTPNELFSKYFSKEQQTELKDNFFYLEPISAFKISDYNAIRKLNGEKEIELKENEILVGFNTKEQNSIFSTNIDKLDTIDIDGNRYTIKNNTPIEETINIAGYSEMYYLIIPDNFSGSLQLEFTSFNVVYEEKYAEQSDKKFATLFNNLAEDRYKTLSPALVIGGTWDQIQDKRNGAVALVVFLGLFLGLIFIITSAAILALQQLSDASDSLERYQSLKKIGVTETLINKAILSQSLIYFIVPLGLAIIHSIIGIIAVRDIFNLHYESIIACSVFLAIIYGGYFYATYIGIKNIVKNSY